MPGCGLGTLRHGEDGRTPAVSGNGVLEIDIDLVQWAVMSLRQAA